MRAAAVSGSPAALAAALAAATCGAGDGGGDNLAAAAAWRRLWLPHGYGMARRRRLHGERVAAVWRRRRRRVGGHLGVGQPDEIHPEDVGEAADHREEDPERHLQPTAAPRAGYWLHPTSHAGRCFNRPDADADGAEEDEETEEEQEEQEEQEDEQDAQEEQEEQKQEQEEEQVVKG